MFKKRIIAAGVALALGAPALALAAGEPPAPGPHNGEVEKIREELRQLREAYEARIQTLEKRLADMEAARSASAPVEPVPVAAASPVPVAASGRGGESAFNPAISLVLAGAYGNLSRDPNDYAITGFVPKGNDASPGTRGFSLRESELAIAANIDPDFRGNLLLSVDENNAVSVEEGYFETIGLGNGLSLKGGRFHSGIGYQNEIHSHAWDFADAPLVYRAFLGGDNYADDGLQLRWLAPTDQLLEFGAEVGRGKNPPGSNRSKNGSGAGTLFAHLGDDIGDSASYRLGVSALRTAPRDAQVNDTDAFGNAVTNAFTGSTRIVGADFVYKYAPNGNAMNINVKLQGEYFRRRESGTLAYDVTGINGLFPASIASGYASSQSGWYLQGVYQFMPRWRAGLRFDRLGGGGVDVGAANLANVRSFDYSPSRTTLMFDFSPSEFSRFRLQFAQDKSRQDAADNQVFLQYIFSLGAHGAHKF